MAFEIPVRKKTFPWFIILLIMFVIISGIIVWSLYGPSKHITEKPQIEKLLTPIAFQAHEAKLDFESLIYTPLFQVLTSSINWPLILPSLGRPNPFLPL